MTARMGDLMSTSASLDLAEALISEGTPPAGVGRAGSRPDPEVVEPAVRRTFTADYGRRILAELDAAAGQEGAAGRILRGEWLSHPTSPGASDGAVPGIGARLY